MSDMTANEVLTTTRTVRRRLDVTRAVPLDVIWECIEIALQAPTGGGVERWRWLVVTDAEQRKGIAELYRDAALATFKANRDGAEDERTRKVYADAVSLAERLEEVPAIVIPCSLGTPPAESSGAAGFFGSILPAAWSFQLALRSRGLGSAYTTAGLSCEAELRSLLGIPNDVTPAVILPVAYTIGTGFRPARRSSVRSVSYIDRWGNAPAAIEGV